MKNNAFSIAVFLLVFTGCQTITVVNDSQKLPHKEDVQDQWNHTGIFGLVGYSGEFDVKELCKHDWSTITTQRGVLASLASAGLSLVSLAPTPVGPAASLANFLWDPLTLKWQCASSSSEIRLGEKL